MWVGQDKGPVYIYAVDQFTLKFISACFYKCRLEKFFILCWSPTTTGMCNMFLEILSLVKENVWGFCIILGICFLDCKFKMTEDGTSRHSLKAFY